MEPKQETAAAPATQVHHLSVPDILESITDGFVAIDPQGCFSYVNHRAERLMGKKRHTLMGVKVWDAFPELLGSKVYEQYTHVAREREPVEFEEYYGKRQIWLEIRAYPAHDGMVVYFRDISRRNRAEQAQRGLVAMVSHDLRNPLFLIKGSAELLSDQLDQPEPDIERVRQGLDRIQRASWQMSSVIDDLVDLVQLQSGHQIELNLGPVDLVALARRAVDIHQFSTQAHRIVLRAEVEELVGDWDGDRLDRVLSNLLTNAIKYSPAETEIVVGVAVEPGAHGWNAVLTVADHGLGIPAEDLPQIFERFYRASNVAGVVPGAGVGLAGARHTVERHGGTIRVASQQGAGTTFTVSLPLPAVRLAAC